MKMEINLSGVDGILKTLKSLPAEVVSKRGGPVKLALAKGARLLRNEVKKNLRAVISSDESTGLLEKNIIASRGKAPTVGNGERYLVRVKRRTYIDRTGKPVTTLKTANILEYGSEKQTAKPFIRPAAVSKAQQTINVVTSDLKMRLDKVVKDLARINK